ncbi:cancer/testis antigen family 47 member A11 [Phyllostomus hastatus]|uniref:cancer/testis antigen family 47 member A11 n=1 Tax=Phyllostomus hastatus TaxID=9423 RepID=UPI001E682849|nr:cancer/testis antigen family 47 member A11 [Phyllostomus hastatus]
MSDTGEGNPTLGGQENPLDDARAWVWEAGAEDVVIHDSGPYGNEEGEGEVEAEVEVLGEAEGGAQGEAEAGTRTGTQPGEAGVTGAVGGLDVEATAARVPEGGVSGEDYNMAPAHDGEQYLERRAPRLVFLDLVHTMLHRLYYNDHIIVPPRRRLRVVQPRSQMPIHVSGIRMLSVSGGSGEGAAAIVPEGSREGATAVVPRGSGEGAAALVPRGSGEGAAAMVPKGSGEGAAAMAPEDQPEADVQEPAQKAEGPEETTKYQYENTEEESQDAEAKEKKEFNENKDPKRM